MAESDTAFHFARTAFIPADYQDATDFADCALDEQLEQLQRQYATASRAAGRARFELELLEKRDDIGANILAQAQRRRTAAESRCTLLLRTIEALEERLERPSEYA